MGYSDSSKLSGAVIISLSAGVKSALRVYPLGPNEGWGSWVAG